MLDVSLIFKMAGAGICLLVLDNVLKSCGKQDIATVIDIAGVVILLLMVIVKVCDLFNTVKTMFMV